MSSLMEPQVDILRQLDLLEQTQGIWLERILCQKAKLQISKLRRGALSKHQVLRLKLNNKLRLHKIEAAASRAQAMARRAHRAQILRFSEASPILTIHMALSDFNKQ